MYNAVSFPNLGIGQIKLSPTAVSFGNISIRWYAIIIVIGIITAYLVTNRLTKRFGVKPDDLLDCLLYTLPVAFIGARLFYVLGDLDSFDSFYDVIAIWNGGLAIYGGIIFSLISVFVICKIKKCSPYAILDLVALGFLIGQAIGRWGNFVNIEVYGVTTNLPWAMGIGYFGEGASELVHPLFLYESLWNLIGFILIYGYMDFRKYEGELFLWYCSWYGLGRALMEPLRNSEYNLHLFGIRIMMVLAIAIFVVSTALIIFLRIRKKEYLSPKAVEEVKSEPTYEKQFHIENSEQQPTEEENEDGNDN